jgi:hypothetical protein
MNHTPLVLTPEQIDAVSKALDVLYLIFTGLGKDLPPKYFPIYEEARKVVNFLDAQVRGDSHD